MKDAFDNPLSIKDTVVFIYKNRFVMGEIVSFIPGVVINKNKQSLDQVVVEVVQKLKNSYPPDRITLQTSAVIKR
ncbi:MAG: hypothetical protein DWQ19_10815 [Crenarchaeota archaeon]|nr:MAG: hypothetical protein DWQ19_10815 [Thermoproteota archaeon]